MHSFGSTRKANDKERKKTVTHILSNYFVILGENILTFKSSEKVNITSSLLQADWLNTAALETFVSSTNFKLFKFQKLVEFW